MNQDPEIIYQLQQGNIKAFKALCYDYAEDMTILAYILLEDSNRANQVVDGLLLRLWSEDGFRNATAPLHRFLFQEVKKACEILPCPQAANEGRGNPSLHPCRQPRKTP